MDAKQVEAVIGKLAEKFGMAADAVQPMFAELIRQIQAWGLAQAVICGAILGACLGVCVLFVRAGAKSVRDAKAGEGDTSDEAGVCVGMAITSLVAAVVVFIPMMGGIKMAVAPYLYLLDKL